VRVSDRATWRRYLSAAGVAVDKQYVALQAIDKMERQPVANTREKLSSVGLSGQKLEEILAIADGKVTADSPELKHMLGALGDRAGYCQVDFKIVRGLAYYTGIVWEIHDRKRELRAIAGGGRYDTLLAQLGGVDLPALGFGMGDVVLTELLKSRGLLPKIDWGLDCYVIITEESLRADALKLVRELRDDGFAVDYSLTEAKVGKQFQMADALDARFALTLGPEEWKAGTIKLKKLATGEETTVPLTNVKEVLGKGE